MEYEDIIGTTTGGGAACAHAGRASTCSATTMADRLAPLLLLFLLLESGGVKATLCSNDTTLRTKLDLMLAEYERQTIPARAQVQVVLTARHATLREGTATLRLLADLAMKWQDDRLSWNASDWDCDVAHVDAELIWLPDMVALTSGAISGTGGDPQKAQLASSGVVDWTMRLDISTPCALDLAEWPSDTQSCNIQFGSRNFNADYLNLTLGNVEKASFQLVAAAWNLVSTQAFSIIQEREYDTYSAVSWTVKLMRRAPAHRLVCQVVSTAIVLQIIAAAILSPASRPPLCASAALIATICHRNKTLSKHELNEKNRNKTFPNPTCPRGESDCNPPPNTETNQDIKQTLKICAYNVRTLASTERFLELTNALSNINWDILGLAEIRKMECKIKEYSVLIFCYIGETKGLHGVGFIIKEKYKNNITDFIGISERVALLQLKFECFSLQ
ncbi:Neuronal acetylcholine receptor subunit beta-3 [Eumeta japonica]|uniref:Neuronal acetylcholine receptor subunit beta-3 n=1 Tax=Eumeta variegata TaxID=151549 RepID=A0A4C1Z0P5_EUMVA|nr:Neuronal acetylcholine receptor subunit beta-3 [Eumeta japonica]